MTTSVASENAVPSSTYRIGGVDEVRRIGFGAMRLTGQPGNFGPYADWDAGKALLREAVALGVDFIDTARSYGPLWNERLVGEALAGLATPVFVASKGGIEKPTPTQVRVDGSPQALVRHAEESLRALGRDALDLYYLHRPDPSLPLEESVGALARLREAGKIRHVGVSNVTLEQLTRARAVVPVAAVQNRYNVAETESDDVLDYAAAHGIAFVPYGPLGANPMRPGAPLAQRSRDGGDGGAVDALRALLRRAQNVLPIPGTTSLAHLRENVAALTG